MAGRIVDAKSAAITAASAAGYVTVASSTGFYKGAKVFLTKLTVHQAAVIVDIVGNTIGVRFVADAFDTLGQGVGYGRSNVASPTDFNTGTIDQPEQFIYNPNDLPLS